MKKFIITLIDRDSRTHFSTIEGDFDDAFHASEKIERLNWIEVESGYMLNMDMVVRFKLIPATSAETIGLEIE